MNSVPDDLELGTQPGHPTSKIKTFRKMIGSVPILMWKQMRAICTNMSQDKTFSLRKAVEEACYAWIRSHWDRLPEDLQRTNYYEGEDKAAASFQDQDDINVA